MPDILAAQIKSPGLAGSSPGDDPCLIVRSYHAEGVIKFGRAAMRGSSDGAVVLSGASAEILGVAALSLDASGVNEEDAIAKTIGQYEQYDLAGIVEKGIVTVFAEEGVTQKSEVRVRHTAPAATSGYQAIGFDQAISGTDVPEISTNDYDIDVAVDGGATLQLSFSLSPTDDWDTIAAAIQAALRTATGSTETVAVTSGAIRFTSATTGDASSMEVSAGTAGSAGGDLVAAIGIVTTTGRQALSSSPTTFIGATVPGLDDDYDLDVAADMVSYRQLTVTIAVTDDWDAIAAALQVALRAATGGSETVEVDSGELVFTSGTSGVGSSMRVKAGTAGSTGGDLLTAIDGLVGYAVTIEDPQDGGAEATGAAIENAVDGMDEPEPMKGAGNFATTADPGRTALLTGAEYRGARTSAGLVALRLLGPLALVND